MGPPKGTFSTVPQKCYHFTRELVEATNVRCSFKQSAQAFASSIRCHSVHELVSLYPPQWVSGDNKFLLPP